MLAPGNLSCFLKAQAIIFPLPTAPLLFSKHIHHLQSFLLKVCKEPAAEWREVGGHGFSTLGVGGACGLGSFPGGASGKEPICQCSRYKKRGFMSWVGKIPWRRAWQPTPVFLPGESQGQRTCRELSGCEIPRGVWVGFLLTVFALMPLDSLTCPSADLLSPLRHGGPTSVLLVPLETDRFL